MGLYVVPTEPDGNCMFRAISDQVAGDDRQYREVRQDICDYLESRPDEYSAFIMGNYENYVRQMRKNGEYGTQVELAAYSHMTLTDIHLFRPDTYYVMHCDNNATKKLAPHEKNRIFLAYHDHEHYSSIRNNKGPHVGPPMIEMQVTDIPSVQLRPADAPPSSTEKAIMGSTGATIDRVRELMRLHKSDHNRVTNILLEDHSSSDSNAEESQSSARSQTPDTSVLSMPNRDEGSAQTADTSVLSMPHKEEGSASDASIPRTISPAAKTRSSTRQNRRAIPYKSRSPSPQDTIIVRSPSPKLNPPSPPAEAASVPPQPKRLTGREKKDAARKRKVLRRGELLRAKAQAAKVKQPTPTPGADSPIYV